MEDQFFSVKSILGEEKGVLDKPHGIGIAYRGVSREELMRIDEGDMVSHEGREASRSFSYSLFSRRYQRAD